MATLDLTEFLPEPLEINIAGGKLISPVPGKTKALELAAAYENPAETDKTEEDLLNMLFTRESLEAFAESDPPVAAYNLALSYAILYWMYGQGVADAAVKQMYGVDNEDNQAGDPPKA